MPRLHDKLSPRQNFWLGFACCPLITFAAIAFLVFLVPYMNRALEWLPRNWSDAAFAFFWLSGFVYLVAIPVFSGFGTAFFWHHLKSSEGNQSQAAFWSIVLTALTLPVLFQHLIWIFLLLLLPVFFVLYGIGLSKGHDFWGSNRARQWLGDFSDLGPPDAPKSGL